MHNYHRFLSVASPSWRAFQLVLLTSVCVVQAACAQSGAAVSARAVPAEQIDYQAIAPFVRMGAAWGDRSKGAHGSFGRFPAGAESPPHTHSGAYHGVVIAGLMTNPFAGEQNPPTMGPGSYWFVPAGAAHVTACVSKEPCVFYFHADNAFDFSPAEQ